VSSTIRDVARRARVSVATVSRVLNEKDAVRNETRERVQSAIERLGYVPHGAARSLITRQTNTIGVLLPDIYGEFFSELIHELVAKNTAPDDRFGVESTGTPPQHYWKMRQRPASLS
jgi:DNA-binding LacI/PurR family transcriptional regulator